MPSRILLLVAAPAAMAFASKDVWGWSFAHSATFDVDLGPSFPVDERAGAGAQPIYGRTVHVDLAPL